MALVGYNYFVFLGAKASCLVYVFEEGDELVFELGGGVLG